MTNIEFQQIAKVKLSTLSTESLIKEVKNLSKVISNEANLVSESILDILINRMPESDFIELCDNL